MKFNKICNGVLSCCQWSSPAASGQWSLAARILGACLTGSNYIASTIQESGMIPTISIAETYNSENINIKTIEQRLIELSLGISSAYVVNTWNRTHRPIFSLVRWSDILFGQTKIIRMFARWSFSSRFFHGFFGFWWDDLQFMDKLFISSIHGWNLDITED